MSKNLDRRGFMKRSIAASTAGALSFGFEEKNLHAKATGPDPPAAAVKAADLLPTGRIGSLDITRLICGGNLISGFAHSRDLMYVSPLVKRYFTDDKIMETLHLVEQNGVNTAILRLDADTLRLLERYWNKEGGKLRWIAQVKPRTFDLKTDIDRAIDHGASGVYIQGEVGDKFYKKGRIDLLGEAADYIKTHGAISGIGAHMLEVVVACEKAGFEPDFYMKTFNSKRYWSAGPQERHDSVWAETPEETLEFMKTVEKPWIAFKVLGAGAIPPREGFQYALENGADFLCVGMFDFQVRQDIQIAREILRGPLDRARPWRA